MSILKRLFIKPKSDTELYEEVIANIRAQCNHLYRYVGEADRSEMSYWEDDFGYSYPDYHYVAKHIAVCTKCQQEIADKDKRNIDVEIRKSEIFNEGEALL